MGSTPQGKIANSNGATGQINEKPRDAGAT